MADERIIQTLEHPIRLSVFEGPLDLLLFLIRRQELDIYDIPIQTVTRQYLDVLDSMEQLNLEVAGEFFVMAATLMVIKSRMLLPRAERPRDADDDEEDIDPRWELVQQLIAYKKFKEAAAQLQALATNQEDALPRKYEPDPGDLPPRPLRPSDKIELWNVFKQVLRRLAERLTFGQIHDETVSVADRMEYLLSLSRERKQFSFSSLFSNQKSLSLSLIVATFLALLELTRLKKFTLEQDENFADIQCTAVEDEVAQGLSDEELAEVME